MVNNPASFLKDIKNITSAGPPSLNNISYRNRSTASYLGNKSISNRKKAIRNNFVHTSNNMGSARLTTPRDIASSPDVSGATT